jgi:hypothetical protein
MKNFLLCYIVGCFFQCCCLDAYAQSHEKTRSDDSLVAMVNDRAYARGIPITETEFYAQVKRFQEMMLKKDSIKTVNDCIILVRLLNTIAYEEPLIKDTSLRRFFSLSGDYYTYQIGSILQVNEGPRGAVYSKKYDIMLGGSTPRPQDFYYIVKK